MVGTFCGHRPGRQTVRDVGRPSRRRYGVHHRDHETRERDRGGQIRHGEGDRRRRIGRIAAKPANVHHQTNTTMALSLASAKSRNPATPDVRQKVLIANRGEIALHPARACRRDGIKTVVVHSQVDADAKYIKLADESVCIGPAPNRRRATSTCQRSLRRGGHRRAQAIHPGYGFLSENADFSEGRKIGLRFSSGARKPFA